jgi:AAA15 family ATPase/GTPase
MSEVSEAMNKDDYNRFVEEHYVINNQYYDEHKVFTDICKFFDSIISCVLSPKDLKSFMYVGDSDIDIKRIYTIENNNEMSRLLTKYFEACTNNQNKKFNPGELINKWVKAFCIGERVTIEMSSDGYGVMLRLFKDEKDKNGNLLVDEGFGITKLIATLINIEYAILTSDSNIAIEEPENHLHPKYQSLLADMFVDVYKNYGINFIIETHSEYLVRKLQTLVAKKELTAEEVSLQYVYDAKTENRPKGEPHVKSIGIRPDGTLQTSFGPGFFDEADNLAMDLLTIKAMS